MDDTIRGVIQFADQASLDETLLETLYVFIKDIPGIHSFVLIDSLSFLEFPSELHESTIARGLAQFEIESGANTAVYK
jgi:hypothetical protein